MTTEQGDDLASAAVGQLRAVLQDRLDDTGDILQAACWTRATWRN